MTKHADVVKQLTAISQLPEAERELNGKNKAILVKAIVHAMDVGNPTRKFDIALEWARRIVKEFFYQGDRERSLGYEISMLCDRHSSNFASGQIGFINFMVLPYFSLLSSLVPKLGYTTENCKENVTRYEQLKEEYEDEKQKGNPAF